MARSTNGTSDFIDFGVFTELSGATKCAISCWVYRSATGTTAGFGQFTFPYRIHVIWYSDDNIYLDFENGADSFPFTAEGTSGWKHFFINYDGSQTGTARIALRVADTAKTLTAGGADPAASLAAGGNQSSWMFGKDYNAGSSGNTRFWAGSYAEFGLWPDVNLDAGEITALSKGYSPALIRPGALSRYAPIIGRYSPEIDTVGGAAGSLTGTSNIVHPRMIYPRKRTAYSVAAAAGGVFAPYYYQEHVARYAG